MTTRYEQRDRLLIGFASLIDPIRRLVLLDADPTAEIPYIRSQFNQDLDHFRQELASFCQIGRFNLVKERDVVVSEIYRITSILDGLHHLENREHNRRIFPQLVDSALDALRKIPCDDPGTILPAQSPYATFNRLVGYFGAAKDRIQLFDPYLEASTFHRYLHEIPSGVEVVVVTAENVMIPRNLNDRKAVARRDGIVAISELIASEIPDRYEFRVSRDQHDRHARVDSKIYHLGGSLQHAAASKYFTISNLDQVQSNDAFLDDVIARADEWFGHSARTHRRC